MEDLTKYVLFGTLKLKDKKKIYKFYNLMPTLGKM